MDLVTPGLGLFFWQTITFLIVLFLLSKFAWKPINSALREREQSIDQALGAAQRAKDDLEKLKSNNELLLKEARIERDRILRQAQLSGEAVINEAKEKANFEATRMMETARVAINSEKQAALADVKNQAAALSIKIAEKLIKKELTSDNAQKELVKEYIQEANLN